MGKRVAVAISGGGRTLANLIANQAGHSYEVAAVISSSEDCRGNEIALQNDLPLLVGSFSQQQYQKTQQRLLLWLKELQIDWIALAGFLKIFPTYTDFHGKIINIHPALLPKYGGKGMYGMNIHRAVYAARETHSGVTIHYVSDEYDQGEIIEQKAIDISSCRSAEEVAQQVFAIECTLYPRVLDRLVTSQR